MTRAGVPKPSMREVASRAGVSHQTVSRVINGHPSIRDNTRERVLAVIKELNYRPNSAARALVTRRSNRIGVIVDSAVKYGPNATLRAVEDVAREEGYAVSSITLSEDRALTPHVAVDHLMSQGVDALCVIAPRESSVDLLRSLVDGLPALVVKAEPDSNFLTVSVDQREGAALAVRHLLDLGHREIMHLAGPMDWLDARGRERGWRDTLAAAGIAAREPAVGDWTADSGYEYARALNGVPDYTALFAANDQMALGAIHGFRDNGVRVPEDVSIIGFDDLPEARHFQPPLSSIRQDFHALGERAVKTLIAALAGAPTELRSLITPVLVVRDSTAPPRD